MKKALAVWLSLIFLCAVLFQGCSTGTSNKKVTEGNDKVEDTAGNTGSQNPEEPKESPKEVSFIAAGDDLMHLVVVDDAKVSGDAKYDFTPIYNQVKGMVSEADIAYINQETMLGGTDLGLSDFPRFNTPQELGRDLITVGFDVINHSNNHSLDKGVKGVNNTIAFWRSHPEITMMGVYDSQEDRDRVRVVEKNGIRIAFLTYAYSTNGLPIPKDKPYIVSLIDKKLIAADVERAKKVSDAIIVSMHWGHEYHMEPSPEQRDLAKYLADLGVTMVVGMHPHVLQPVEWVKGKDGNEMLVAFSLGNFVSGQTKLPRLLGGMIRVVIKKDPQGKITLEQPEMIPVVNHYEKGYKRFRIYPLESYTEELAAKHGLNGKSRVITADGFKKLAQSILGDWYKPKN
jgi:poly-gamma-glutamate synthesis protein (capsule biosynthesis protein)